MGLVWLVYVLAPKLVMTLICLGDSLGVSLFAQHQLLSTVWPSRIPRVPRWSPKRPDFYFAYLVVSIAKVKKFIFAMFQNIKIRSKNLFIDDFDGLLDVPTTPTDPWMIPWKLIGSYDLINLKSLQMLSFHVILGFSWLHVGGCVCSFQLQLINDDSTFGIICVNIP